MTHGCKDGLPRLGIGMRPTSANPSKILAPPAPDRSPRISCRLAVRVPGKASVYPMQGPFLNPLALSNIETYLPAPRRSGLTPRSFLLRSSLGTSLTMQPISKPAQSMYTKPLQNGTRARSTR